MNFKQIINIARNKWMTRQGFLLAIDNSVGDLLPIGIYADFLDEIGDPKAEFYIWCFDNRCYPAIHKVVYDIKTGTAESFVQKTIVKNYFPQNEIWYKLPKPIRDRIFTRPYNTIYPKPFRTISSLFEAAAETWIKLKSENIDPVTGEKL